MTRRRRLGVGLALGLGAALVLGKGTAYLVTWDVVHPLVGIGILAVVMGVGAWLLLRDATLPMRAVVSPEGLALEPVHRGAPYRFAWRELSAYCYWDTDHGATLMLDGPTDTLYLTAGDATGIFALADTIRGHGVEVRKER